MSTIISGALIVPMSESASASAEKYFPGWVAIEGNRIVLVTADPEEAEKWRKNNSAAEEVDGTGKLLMPGLINTHTHVAMTLMRNMADDLPLMDWLHKRVWPFESRLTADDIAAGARLGMAEMLLGGTTTLVDMYWHESAVARAAEESGIRAVLCPSFVDGPRMEEFERDLEATLEAASGSSRLSVRIAPHAAYSCSGDNLRRAVELAKKHAIGITIHVSETEDEQRIIRERHNLTPTEYLASLGVLDPGLVPTIAAHCVHLSEGDIELLRRHNVTVAHNPQSNMKLASGAAPVARLLAEGVNVSLGTDGAASNNDLDMWDEMRSASLLGKLTAGDPSVLPAYDVLRMATCNAARALGRGGELGEISPGALADLVLIDTSRPHWQPLHNPVNALVYSAKSSDVCAVWVDGRRLVSEGRLIP